MLFRSKITREQIGTELKGFWIVWRFFMRYIIPLVIFIIIVQKSGLFDFALMVERG